MKALITGGSGRVGTELVPLIVSQGWDVRVLQRGASQPLPAAMSGVEVVAGSVTDRAIVDAAIADVDVVCHLAALMPPVSNDQLFEANLRGSFNLLEAIRMSAKRPALVYASTDATYGTGLSDRPYPEPIVEDTAPRPTNFYGVTKLAAERMLSHYCRIYALSFPIRSRLSSTMTESHSPITSSTHVTRPEPPHWHSRRPTGPARPSTSAAQHRSDTWITRHTSRERSAVRWSS